jgi:cytochrome d ubiquinol oxidase subunit II
MMFALNAYVLFGGADFGGGVWDALAAGPRRNQQRALISRAIGPVWEANHVWLILVVVLLFACFPAASARLGITLHIPLTLMLFGVVLRGVAFTFRAYDSQRDEVQRRWGRLFAISSIGTPVLLGICIGAITSGRLPSISATRSGAPFMSLFVVPWLSAFTVGVGLLALVLFAFLAAVYLTIEAGDHTALQEDFRRRALLAAIAVFAIAFIVLAVARQTSTDVGSALVATTWAPLFHAATGAAAIAAILALGTRRYRVARIAAAAQVSLILWGWPLAQRPYLVPPDMTIASAAAPAVTLRLVLIALSAGALVVIPSLGYLLRVFKRGRDSA